MGRRGRPPAPTRIKVLRGTRPYRINQDEPVARVGVPEPPLWLSPHAREVWDELTPEIKVMAVTSPLDRYQLAIYCVSVAHYREVVTILNETGPTVQFADGRLGRNPLLSAQRDLATMILKAAGEFGLSPRARSEIRTRRPHGDDPRERLLTHT